MSKTERAENLRKLLAEVEGRTPPTKEAAELQQIEIDFLRARLAEAATVAINGD